MSENFNLDIIDKTFTSYKKGQSFEGVVVLKREDGVIFYCEQWRDYTTAWSLYRHCNGSLQEWVAEFKM